MCYIHKKRDMERELMKRSVLYAIMLLIFFSLLTFSCSTVQLGSASHLVADDAFGLAHAGEEIEDYPFIEKMNADWIRQTFRWDNINPEPEVWLYDRFDALMDLADKNDVKVIAVLAYDVGWIHPDGVVKRHISPELSPYYFEYIRRVVERYRGRVDAWEIWNEPNVVYWKGPNKDFFTLAAKAATLIKELDMDTPLLVGSTFRVDSSFIRGLHEYGAFEYADALSIHPYTISPNGVSRQIIKAKNLLEELDLDKELWITEIGFPTRGLYPTKVNESKFPDYVIKTLTAATSHDIRVTVWFKNYDTKNNETSKTVIDSGYFFGLGYKDRTLKNGGLAFSIFSRNVKGMYYDPSIISIDDSLSSSVVSASYRDSQNTNVFIVLWGNGGINQNISVSTPNGTVREINPVSGKMGESISEWYGLLTDKPVLLRLERMGDMNVFINPVIKK